MIRPSTRDLGFLLIGLALGVGIGSALAGLNNALILIPVCALTLTGSRLIQRSAHR